jgi:hypothetical protein
VSAVRLRVKADGGIRVVEHPEDVPPDQLVKLRAYRDELAPVLEAYGEAVVEIRPATPIPPAPTWPPKPPLPRDWQDRDGWLALLGYAHLVERRRWVVARWAQAAGGEVRDGTLHLPADLPRGLALAELRTAARNVGLSIKDLP